MLEVNNIYNMDCIEGLKQIDDSTVDLIVTSPPYNVGVAYDAWSKNSFTTGFINLKVGYAF